MLYIGQSFQDLCLAHAQRPGDVDTGQGVHHLMLAIDVHGCRLCQQIAVKGNATGILRDIPIGKQILPFIMAKALHRGSPRQLLLPQRQLEHILFPVEQKHAVFLQTVHDLRFCAGDIFDGPQIFQMCFSDIGDDSDIRLYQAGQRIDLITVLHAHLHDRHLRRIAESQQRQRYTDLVVHVAMRFLRDILALQK